MKGFAKYSRVLLSRGFLFVNMMTSFIRVDDMNVLAASRLPPTFVECVVERAKSSTRLNPTPSAHVRRDHFFFFILVSDLVVERLPDFPVCLFR